MSRFILSCTTCALRAPGKDELLETLKHAPVAGFKYWGVAGPPFWTPGVPQWIDADKINKLARDAGLEGMTEVYAAGIVTDSPQAAEAYVRNRLVHSFHLAERLHCPLVVFSGGKRQEGGLEASIAGVKALLPLIEDMPVRMALEPHYRSQYQSAEDYDVIFAAIDHPQVGITVDTGHFHSAGVDIPAFIQKYRDKIFNAHLKDHVGTESVPIGKGEINLKRIFEALDEIDYQGPIALELEVRDAENLPKYVAEAYPYLKHLILEVTGQVAE